MGQKNGKELSTPTPPPPVVAVLGDDDLLREILVRLDFPTYLVRAALVCKLWLRHASDPAVLRRFRELHPPRLLGLYIVGAEFVPLPHPPELDVLFRRALFQVRGTNCGVDVAHCRNGRILTVVYDNYQSRPVGCVVWSPLRRTRGLLLPYPPKLEPLPPNDTSVEEYKILPEDGHNCLSCTIVRIVRVGTEVFAQQIVLQYGSRDVYCTSAIIEPRVRWQKSYTHRSLLVHKMFYVLGIKGYILGLDLVSMSFLVIDLPDGGQQQQQKYLRNLELSMADGSGFYLVHLKDLQIHVWHHDTDSGNADGWQPVHAICACQAIGHLARPNWKFTWMSRVWVFRVGNNSELLLKVGCEVFYMHIRNRKVEKVLDLNLEDGVNVFICPFTMVWPPNFPVLSEE
ncbi:hypothetical protein PR202_gb07005 [Eleusine coracana subsp. coracana]|uniref:F-box domain-containing protein n=1 Tax=Eleusine coracana subsp. coracana TaxID=191504 RepID=A0AAV5EBJ6_ELECO|nr:hypothetical protein QOZ80_2BG0164930 [Eleusine coracana subsp. coracana]GJN19703.1 hypothetical protein PR202_gb07005 [Eleusine coracana subsp. coracana]